MPAKKETAPVPAEDQTAVAAAARSTSHKAIITVVAAFIGLMLLAAAFATGVFAGHFSSRGGYGRGQMMGRGVYNEQYGQNCPVQGNRRGGRGPGMMDRFGNE